ncbi:hypothetical protein QZH41_004425 [Actinostola sp. cb2023]|nr:hypothetical protein QZH41_004425 [Actinostola sp. cb2023]
MPHVQSVLDVIVKITYAAVSGTDLDVLEGKIQHSKSIILGHQFVGIVKEMGADVKHVIVGDRVVVNPHTSCNMCDFCLKGQPYFCKVEGKNATIGLKRNGGWAQFCRLTAKNVIPLPHQVTFEQALFAEPLSCVLHGWKLLGPIQDDVETQLNERKADPGKNRSQMPWILKSRLRLAWSSALTKDRLKFRLVCTESGGKRRDSSQTIEY